MLNKEELNFQTEIEKYMFLHSHECGHKGGVFSLYKDGKTYSGGMKKVIDMVNFYLSKGNQGDFFLSLNTYRKAKNSFNVVRSDDTLWGIDTIMIDIDGDSSLCGRESELEKILEFAWNTERIPKPNLVSYTGGGGIHLYYALHRLPASMAGAVKALKKAIADLIVPIEKEFPFGVDYVSWKVDYKVFDNQRMDRIPGSVNPKTGNRCVCHIVHDKRYEYKELLDFVNSERLCRFSNAVMSKRNNRKSVPIRYTSSFQIVEQRIENMLKMVARFKHYTGRREIIGFIIRNWCFQLKYNDKKTFEIMRRLNNSFSEPLPYRELIRNTRVRKIYRLSQKYIIKMLDLSAEEIRILFPNYRPGDQKEKAIKAKIEIAQLVLKGYSCLQIASATGYSLSVVKRRRTEMNKEEGFEYWASYKETIEEEQKGTAEIVPEIISGSECDYIISLYYVVEDTVEKPSCSRCFENFDSS